jgi:hypothetical protein
MTLGTKAIRSERAQAVAKSRFHILIPVGLTRCIECGRFARRGHLGRIQSDRA